MSCVIFGAGKIARGFIAHLLSLSDIDFVFVEKADALADLIVATAERADRPEEAAYFAGDMMAGMANS